MAISRVIKITNISSRYPKSIIKVSYGIIIAIFFVLVCWGIGQLYQQELVQHQQEINTKTISVDMLLKTTLSNVNLLKSQAEYLINQSQISISSVDAARISYWYTTGAYQGSYSFDYAPKNLFSDGQNFNLFALQDADIGTVGLFRRNKGINLQREVEMSLSLAPLLRPIYEQLPGKGSVHYTSLAGLAITYPATPPMTRETRIKTFQKTISQLIISGMPEANPGHKSYFTHPYQDISEKELIVTASSPVYQGDKYLGNVGIDFTLEALKYFVKQLGGNDTMVVAAEGQVLSYPSLQTQSMMPVHINHLIKNSVVRTKLLEILKTGNKGQVIIDGHVITYQRLDNAPWLIINITPVKALIENIFITKLSIILGCIVGVSTLLLISLQIISRVFELLNQSCAVTEQTNQKLQNTLIELEFLAYTDKLTGTWNRRYFEQVASAETNRVKRHNQPLSLLILDIDYFKSINDKYGHYTGDVVLCEVACLIKENIRTSDVLTRWGGEEFVILAPSTSIADATELAERLRLVVAGHTWKEVGNITVSFGVAQFQEHENLDICLKRADYALYQAKNSGRNTVMVAPNIVNQFACAD
ncbi:MAG: diguanylate cyclase [Calothrix sp. C42_A2020_038]|nr:diguanylate cyclase [Calothrix sp. C42_A2020_038]